MMKRNPRYRNLTILTMRQICKYRKNEYRDKHKCFRIIVICLAAFMALLGIIMAYCSSISRYNIINVIISAVLVYIYMFGYKTKAIKQYRHIMGRDPDLTYLFYDDEMCIERKKSQVYINYENIESIEETDEQYILVLGDTRFIVSKDGFMSGSESEYRKFIESRICL